MPPVQPNVYGARLLRNLRDLQLDDELDFPDIDALTFDSKDSVHNQAQRIRKAEWTFFHLLQTWDPVATKDLNALFPAYDPKQSLDLRGAIFQHLSILKKEGVFPKDLILRKTMFDECKGSKFEELLVAFSTSVLLKVLDRDGKDVSAVKTLLMSDKVVDIQNLQALEASYRFSLSRSLDDRHNLRRRWHRFGRVLKVKEDEIKQRRREHELKVDEAKQTRIPKRRLERLEAHIERDWVGSSEWRSIIQKSDQHLPDKSLLERSYDEVWQHASEDSLYHFRPEKARSSLQRLEYQVEKQNQRLAKWREVQKTLNYSIAQNKRVSPPLKQTQGAGSPELGTTAYETENRSVHDPVDRDASPPRPSTAKRTPSKHKKTLSVVTKDLDGLQIDERTPPDSTKKKTPEGDQKMLSSNPSSSKANRRRSNTVIFSPQVSLGSKSSMERLDEQNGSPTEECDSSFDFDEDATNIINSVLQAEPSPIKPPKALSLTERARLSMAPRDKAQPSPSAANRTRSISPSKQGETTAQLRDRPLSVTLDERTRQSMSIVAASMAPPLEEPSSRPTTSRRVTVAKRSSRSPEKRQRLPRQETPELTLVEESLLNESADEDTIFMSRPRVAHSPPLLPVQDSDEQPVADFPDDGSVEDFS